ncbi:chorismate--pyruvate lyase family protein [Thiorhodovibrio frisius]|uniref:4-hydroxybenzoate synthetase (Chorismate lyase) n=1 Tax=Thiorhodovibrio frisius TaxID=631362 RepID=H8Z6V0_9GAMM|nr:chorismate pyruvate-lyase family protein [Thiorhodovibrio frisius]EIC19735.1 4-hydroxybenzoate synthetase (chorismate lyase) [Thiorhodovibrio frisius]WPL20297.1 Chorismate--pyruvate lyase [Thiorhodovibrio frisius]
MKQFYPNARAADTSAEANPFRCQGFVRDGTIACLDGSRRAIQSLPAFLRALLVTDGTVTKILEAFFWEPVMVDTLYQEFTTAEAAIPWVEIRPGDRALARRVRLRGGDSGLEYARADSVVRSERVPDHFRQRLIDREIGIGALIRDSGLESYREVMEVGVNPGTADAGQSPQGDSLFRTYRIIIGSEPVILITETFPLALFRTPNQAQAD